VSNLRRVTHVILKLKGSLDEGRTLLVNSGYIDALLGTLRKTDLPPRELVASLLNLAIEGTGESNEMALLTGPRMCYESTKWLGQARSLAHQGKCVQQAGDRDVECNSSLVVDRRGDRDTRR
jgi:hypothetical protein